MDPFDIFGGNIFGGGGRESRGGRSETPVVEVEVRMAAGQDAVSRKTRDLVGSQD